MELTWSTFVLEIINFLVLVWILQRFLYRPVLDVIDRRQKAIEQKLADARHLNEEAEELKARYGGRVAAWDEERRKARETLATELDDERSRRLRELDAELEQEKQKLRVAQERKAAEQRRAAEHEAMDQAATFASRILGQASGPDLEARLVNLLVSALDDLGDDELDELREQWGEPLSGIEVTTAFDLSAEQREALKSRLIRISGNSVPVHFRQDERLVAGALIEVGAWVLAANVRDELKGFAELSIAVE